MREGKPPPGERDLLVFATQRLATLRLRSRAGRIDLRRDPELLVFLYEHLVVNLRRSYGL